MHHPLSFDVGNMKSVKVIHFSLYDNVGSVKSCDTIAGELPFKGLEGLIALPLIR
jgi:hypothetical protein